MKEKILILEDEIGIRSFVSINLKREGYEVIEAGTGSEAIEKLSKEEDISIALLDVMLPDMSGIEICKYIRQNFDQVGIIMLTAKSQEEDKIEGFISGTDDYMVKPIDINELVLRVGALLKRAKINVEHKLEIGGTILDYNSLSVKYNDKEIVLPLKEFKLLFKLLSFPDKIFTRTQIMNECWGMYSESYDRTIDVHITHIREKFADNLDFSIVTVRGLGYKAVINNGK